MPEPAPKMIRVIVALRGFDLPARAEILDPDPQAMRYPTARKIDVPGDVAAILEKAKTLITPIKKGKYIVRYNYDKALEYMERELDRIGYTMHIEFNTFGWPDKLELIKIIPRHKEHEVEEETEELLTT